MKAHYLQLYDYNSWANALFAEKLKEGKHQNEKIDVFYSHIAAAQMLWLSRIGSTDERVPGVFELMPLEETCRLLDYSNEQYLGLIEAAENLEQIVPYKTTEGDLFSNRLVDLLTHVANHGTHHRSQIALLLREEGIEPPASDFIYYLRAKG